VRVRIREQDKREEGAEAAVEDGRADLLETLLRARLARRTRAVHERVADVRCVVDAEADGEDEVDARDHVHRQTPPVHPTCNVHLTKTQKGKV